MHHCPPVIKCSLLAVSLLAAGVAAGQAPVEPTVPPPEAGEQVAPTFDSIDINKDSLVNEQEATSAKAMTLEAFAAADSDQDGFLTREEFDPGA